MYIRLVADTPPLPPHCDIDGILIDPSILCTLLQGSVPRASCRRHLFIGACMICFRIWMKVVVSRKVLIFKLFRPVWKTMHSVMQSGRNSFCGDVVQMTSRDKNSILDVCSLFRLSKLKHQTHNCWFMEPNDKLLKLLYHPFLFKINQFMTLVDRCVNSETVLHKSI